MKVAVAAIGAVMLAGAQSALAATITVDTTADAFGSDMAHCSLREAIKSVDGASGSDPTGANFGGCLASGSYATGVDPPDTVMVPSGIYQLSLSGSAEDSDVSGDLDVFRSMNIVGTGNPTIQQTVAGNRVLDVSATGKDLSLSGLTITGGDQASSDGGGIHFRGGSGAASLTLDGVTVTGNDVNTTGNGGGIYTDSPTTITNSVISDNKAAQTSGTGDGGGIYQDGFADPFSGVTLSVDHSSITGNFAGTVTNAGEGGGIFRKTKSGDVTSGATVQSSEISGNTAHNSGGGINSSSDGTLQVLGSLISGNHALTQRGGGMIAVSNQSSGSGQVTVVNSTIAGNNASGEGGGITGGAEGLPVDLELLFSTLAQNTGSTGSELFFDGNSGPKPSYTVEGTIFAASVPSAMNACSTPGSGFAIRTDNGYNISSDPTDATLPSNTGPGCGVFAVAPGDRTGLAVPLVNPLADNGGPTETMEPTASSFAVDNMPNSVCAAISPAVTTDQRGFARPEVSGGNCDSGAYEVQPPILTAIGDKTVQAGQLLTFTAPASDLDPGDTLTYSASNLPAGASFIPGTQTFSWTPTAAQVGTFPNVHFDVSDGFSSDAEDISIAVTAAPPTTSTGPGPTSPTPQATKKKCKKKKHRAAAAKKCKKRKK